MLVVHSADQFLPLYSKSVLCVVISVFVYAQYSME